MKKRLTTQAVFYSIMTASVLALTKLIAGLSIQSMAVLASALDSLMDVASSTVNYLAARESDKPPDEDHAYGHEKIESLAGLFQSSLIGVTGLYLAVESVKRLVTGSHVTGVPVGIGVMVFSMLATLLLVWRLKKFAQDNPSMILSTERLHYATDILQNAGVIAALVLVKMTGWVFWDMLVSIIVSAYIFRAAWEIFRRSVDELVDKSLPPAVVKKIQKIILGFHPSIVGIHNFRSRRVGQRIFLDFHIEIRGQQDFKKAHLMTESLIDRVRKSYPEADLTVHYDPEGEQ